MRKLWKTVGSACQQVEAVGLVCPTWNHVHCWSKVVIKHHAWACHTMVQLGCHRKMPQRSTEHQLCLIYSSVMLERKSS